MRNGYDNGNGNFDDVNSFLHKMSEECLIKLNNSTFTETGVNADKVRTSAMVAMLLIVVGGFFAFFAICAVCLNKRCVPKSDKIQNDFLK
jgi:hypothetical protein